MQQPARERDQAQQDAMCLSRMLQAALQTKKELLEVQLARQDETPVSATDRMPLETCPSPSDSKSTDGARESHDTSMASITDTTPPVLSASIQLRDAVMAMATLADQRSSDVARVAAGINEAMQSQRTTLQAEQSACAAELDRVVAIADRAESVHTRRLRANDVLARLAQVQADLKEKDKANIQARHTWEALILQ